jgi:hypothetical protein
MHLEFLVEDSSGAAALEILVPRILGEDSGHTWNVHAYRGIGRLPKGMKPNSDPAARALLNQLPKLLQGYGAAWSNSEVDMAVIVVCDLDDRCLKAFRGELDAVLAKCRPAPTTRFCIAVKELENWYLGDFAGLQKTYPRLAGKLPKRHPDETQQGTWEFLADLVLRGGADSLRDKGGPGIGEQKHQWAKQICPVLAIESNRSPSFQYFYRAVRGLVGG